MADTATILEIQRMSTEDGPGIRTTVFLKGCSLACSWCHNPESISAKPEVIWHDWKCIACRACEDCCPTGARRLTDEGARVDRELCTDCGTCEAECPAGAIERMGTPWELDALVAEVAKDRAYFEASGGGVSVSGGEPTLQAGFVRELLRRCRELGLHTALDTCGLCATERLLEVAAEASLVLFDLKEIDPARHERFTGAGNRKILANLRALAGKMREDGGGAPELWIRTPLIPGATTTAENIGGIGALIAAELGDLVTRWELCAFNDLCESKYRRLGRPWPYADQRKLSASELESFARIARSSGVDPTIVAATGPTRYEEPAAPREAGGMG